MENKFLIYYPSKPQKWNQVKSSAGRFTSQRDAQVMKFWPHGTINDCKKWNQKKLYEGETLKKKVGEQILDLLSNQISKVKSLAERSRSQGSAQVMEFCPHGTRIDCAKLIKVFQPISVKISLNKQFSHTLMDL